MADNNEVVIPVKEQTDGSALVAFEIPPDPLADADEIDTEGKKKKKEKKKDDDVVDEIHDDGDEQDDVEEEASDEISDEEREAIRKARREERKLKKELKKQRDLSAQNKIKMLERHNEELAKRLAAVENTAVSYQFAQLDKSIEDEQTRVEYAKMKLTQAAQAGDAAAQVEYLEQLTDAKQRLQQAQHFKKQQLEQAKAPTQNVPNEVSTKVQKNAEKWLKKNSWYDPHARDTDSRIAKVIDQELAGEGWDPADSEYWEELDSRLQTRLPHRYTSKGGSVKRANPSPSSRVANAGAAKPGTITLSRERVQAIKDAGAWDDIEKRNKMIRAYAAYDRANKG